MVWINEEKNPIFYWSVFTFQTSTEKKLPRLKAKGTTFNMSKRKINYNRHYFVKLFIKVTVTSFEEQRRASKEKESK